jgi:hypothetical protein
VKLVVCGVKPKRVWTAPVFLFSAYCDECKIVHEWEVCPDCGSWISPTYGILGSYWICDELCGWMSEPVEDSE